jgi:Flp pilus assembly pilin Flp
MCRGVANGSGRTFVGARPRFTKCFTKATRTFATAWRYALIAAGVAIAIVTTITRTGDALNKIFATLSAAF